jgi:hypothetical protein
VIAGTAAGPMSTREHVDMAGNDVSQVADRLYDTAAEAA